MAAATIATSAARTGLPYSWWRSRAGPFNPCSEPNPKGTTKQPLFTRRARGNRIGHLEVDHPGPGPIEWLANHGFNR